MTIAVKETDLHFNGLRKRSVTQRIIIHHSASPDVSAPRIHQWHLGRGWAGIGYHYVVRSNGNIERGRPEWTIGSHSGAAGNSDGIGIVLTGDFTNAKPTQAQMDALVRLIHDIRSRYGEDLAVIGHKDVRATACPGARFPWNELRKRLEGEALEPWMVKMGEESIDYLVKEGLIKDPDYWKARLERNDIPYWLFWTMLKRLDERRVQTVHVG